VYTQWGENRDDGLAVPCACCRLESDIAVLEQHLETMRATYQLNAEKLEYNYRVLLERDAGGC
jgi:hypothetical protein